MSETTFGFFGPAGELFGAFHAPSPPGRDVAVLLCNPLGAEFLSMHRGMRHLAARLQAGGFATLRFDYLNTGDSAGEELAGDLVETSLSSIEIAAGALRQWSGRSRICLVGLRVGGNLALRAASRTGVDSVVLWAPCASGKAFVRQLQLLSVAEADDMGNRRPPEAEPLTSGGFTWTRETLVALEALDTAPLVGRPQILFLRRDDVADAARLERQLVELGCNVESLETPGFAGMMTAPHATTVPFATLDATVNWLASISSIGSLPLTPGLIQESRMLGPRQRDTIARFGDGGRIFGIVSEPAVEAERNRPAVIILAGSVHRIGHNRMNVPLANRLVEQGFVTFRMDTGGLGDSAPGPGGRDNDPYPPHVVEDVLSGIEYLRTRVSASEILLTGLCAGAYASFHGGMASDAVVHGILVNPLTFYWKPGMSLDVPNTRHAAEIAYYRQASRDWRRWLRLAISPARLARIASTVVGQTGVLIRGFVDRLRGKRTDLERDLERFAQGRRRLSFVLAIGDAGYDILMTHAGRTCKRLTREGRMDIVLIDHANHAFTNPSKREEMFDAVLRFARTTASSQASAARG